MATARCPCWVRPGHWATCGPTAWFVVRWIWTRTRSASSLSAARSRPVNRRSAKWTTDCLTAASRTERPVRDVLALVGMRALFCSGCIGTYPVSERIWFMASPLVHAQGLSKRYGDFEAVADLNLQVG